MQNGLAHAERAGIRQAEGRGELVDLDHGAIPGQWQADTIGDHRG
jgi:hypothetical protein